MDYSNYLKEHPNSLIITNTEEEFVDVGTKLGWRESDCIDKVRMRGKNLYLNTNNGKCLSYSSIQYLNDNASDFKNHKRISYSEFLGVSDDYQIY